MTAAEEAGTPSAPPWIATDADDPRLSPFVNLKNRGDDDYFVTEGRTATARLIASGHEVVALVTDRDDAVAAGLDPSVPRYRLTRPEVSRLVGFRFHRGVLGLGKRPKHPPPHRRSFDFALGLVGVSDPDNVGSLLRTAACLGIKDVLIDPTTLDPLARRVTRVSMAHNLTARFHATGDLLTSIQKFRRDGYEVLAATPSADAMDIDRYRPGPPAVLLMGNEGEGLTVDIQQAATHRVRIAMPPGPDSLNVAVAGAILMHHLRRGQF